MWEKEKDQSVGNKSVCDPKWHTCGHERQLNIHEQRANPTERAASKSPFHLFDADSVGLLRHAGCSDFFLQHDDVVVIFILILVLQSAGDVCDPPHRADRYDLRQTVWA